MKSILTLTLLFSVLSLVACSSDKVTLEEDSLVANYEATQTEDGPLARKEIMTIKAVVKVKDIDKNEREITIVNSEGEESTLSVSSDVRRFDEIQVGDNIRAEYVEALAFEVRPPTESEKVNPRNYAIAATKNEEMLPPGMAAAEISRSIVEITAIDLEAETVTIKNPEGELVTIKAKVPENLKRVKVGDTVAVTFAEAFAIGLEPTS